MRRIGVEAIGENPGHCARIQSCSVSRPGDSALYPQRLHVRPPRYAGPSQGTSHIHIPYYCLKRPKKREEA